MWQIDPQWGIVPCKLMELEWFKLIKIVYLQQAPNSQVRCGQVNGQLNMFL